MSRIIRLTENDISRIVRRVIMEEEDDMDELIDVNVEVENPECWENTTSSDGRPKKRRRKSSSCSRKYKTKSKTSHYGNNWH
jgi:hypothetical protein